MGNGFTWVSRLSWFCRKVCDLSGSWYARQNSSNNKATIMDFKGSQFERDIILWGVRWYVDPLPELVRFRSRDFGRQFSRIEPKHNKMSADD